MPGAAAALHPAALARCIAALLPAPMPGATGLDPAATLTLNIAAAVLGL
jgi:hypothetical protein